MNEVALNKKISIERCIQQIRNFYAQKSDLPFDTDYLKQDAIAMNLQRACQLAIDLANHTIKVKKLGLPQDSKNSFELLAVAKVIDPQLSGNLQAMVGFRNVLVYEYQELDLGVMIDVIENHLDKLRVFANCLLEVLD
ncbi:MAG TPA: DUF86 domain-containing protein [Thioploca sp.]|nr:MAG: hypothetical protein DRR19_07250 [Gammaproteobacteria bacterium]HDN26085.1 DUF86 domain-containing protein [Thioploca sp.]